MPSKSKSSGKAPRHSVDVMAIIKAMTPEARNRLFFAIENNPDLFSGTEHTILPKSLFEFMLTTTKNSLVLQGESLTLAESLGRDNESLLERFGAMIAKPRKTDRNELVHKYLTELNLDFPRIYKVILEEREELMIKGKGKKAKPVQLETMIKEYKRWVKANPQTSAAG